MTRWIQNFLTIFLLCFGVAIVFPIFGHAPEGEHRPSCMGRLKIIGLGFLQYTQDYDDKMPSVKGDEGWANALLPYVKSAQLFQCPLERSEPQAESTPNLTGYTDYYFNAQLQKRTEAEIEDHSKIILAADGNDGEEMTDASFAKPWLPYSWRTDTSSPAFRHLGAANYLFVDGHVKALVVEEVSKTQMPKKQRSQTAGPEENAAFTAGRAR